MNENFEASQPGLGFDSRAGQIECSGINGLPPLQRFFKTVLHRRYAAELGPASCYTLWRQYRDYNEDFNLMTLHLEWCLLICSLNLRSGFVVEMVHCWCLVLLTLTKHFAVISRSKPVSIRKYSSVLTFAVIFVSVLL